MSNRSPGWGEQPLHQAAGTYRLAPSLPGSCPHEPSCQGLMPPHQAKVHTLGVGGCAFPEEPGRLYRIAQNSSKGGLVTKDMGFGIITPGTIRPQPPACLSALRKSPHPCSLSFFICDGGPAAPSLGGYQGS